jgi:dTDP-4-dehydrorhamnose reductase
VRILLTGAAGRLGGRLALRLAQTHDVVLSRHLRPVPPGPPALGLDLLVPGSFGAVLEASGARAVVHAAALADPDVCESDPGRARAVNVRASEALARLCGARGIRFVLVSTDLVFSGERPRWRETDAASPLSVYGRTKLEAERAILSACPDAAVARVSLVCGRGFGPAPTASEAVVWALREGRPARLFTDEYRSPVDSRSVADGLGILAEGHASGVFHLGGPERLSRYELGRRTALHNGLDPGILLAMRAAERAARAPRPRDASLDSTRAATELGWTAMPIAESVAAGRRAPGDPA